MMFPKPLLPRREIKQDSLENAILHVSQLCEASDMHLTSFERPMATLGRRGAILLTVLVFVLGSTTVSGPSIATPTDFFGFEIGTDGELARYPKVLEYLEHLANGSDRMQFEQRGLTTNNHPYVLATFSSKENLDRLDRLIEINHQLSDPRQIGNNEAIALTREGVPFYFLYATIHSTEVGNGQTIINIAHRLATEQSAEVKQILDNSVVLLVPSQNPDGQIMVVDHWYDTKNTPYSRVFPDLYHRYTGHDDNRDWFMFTQKETRLSIDIHTEYRPQLTHDMHQMSATGARIFVPPFKAPYDPNIHPLLLEGQTQIGQAMASALLTAGKKGVIYNDQFDLWTPARQYMLYHGQPRILTEIASALLADPFVNPAGVDRPLGPQVPSNNFPVPYDSAVWRLADIVEYGEIVVFAALKQMADHRNEWLENFYRAHKDWVDRDEAPFAFVVPANQPDPFETYELLEILDFAEGEIHRSRSTFTADGTTYPAGSLVIDLAQPYGAFAKTMLERQVYPDLRYYPGGPPIPPYDVTAHTLGLLMGVDVDQINTRFEADLERIEELTPQITPLPNTPEWAYTISPTSNAAFQAVTQLVDVGVPVFRTAAATQVGNQSLAPGTWIVPPTTVAEQVLQRTIEASGLVVSALDQAPQVSGFRLKDHTRVGLWRVPNNMPGGWMMWLFEQYGLNHQVISSGDFENNVADLYDVIVLPSGTTATRIIQGLSRRRYDESWRWAYGIGPEGWTKLQQWVKDGGTLVALGSAVETARELFDLPIRPVLPMRQGRNRAVSNSTQRSNSQETQRPVGVRVPSIAPPPEPMRRPMEFYCPGSLLKQEHNPNHPVGFGMPERWPVFFRFDQAYELTSSDDILAEVVSKYPDEEVMTASGWLLGDELLRNRANIVSFKVGKGSVVTMGSQIAFRTQPRVAFKLLFNAIFNGPATSLNVTQLARLE